MMTDYQAIWCSVFFTSIFLIGFMLPDELFIWLKKKNKEFQDKITW